jgi:uncharacterized protein YcbK (DUF882 family)
VGGTVVGERSPHFSTDEFVDHHTGHLVRPPAALLTVLEAMRALRGTPLDILSGHRCPSTNRAVGGARNSRHIAGDAADLLPGRFTAAQALACGAVGVGVRDGYVVHVDVRPGRPVVFPD